MKKKLVSLMMTMVMVAGLTACGSAETAKGSVTIGISQFAEHGSLDNCREGFLAGLAEAGFVEGENLTVVFDNAQADMGTASTIADNFVSQKVDLICAIATPSAMSAYNSCIKTEIPVIYTAVSDPVAAGLANEDGTSIGNATGTSDALPVTNQLEMIRKSCPMLRVLVSCILPAKPIPKVPLRNTRNMQQTMGSRLLIPVSIPLLMCLWLPQIWHQRLTVSQI